MRQDVMRRDLTDGDFAGEFWAELAGYRHTAWRWEAQPVYDIGPECASIEALMAGTPEDPERDIYLAPWFRQVRAQVAAGKRIGRLRVLEEPPTDYQLWELWLDTWNRAAGEQIDYVSRSDAQTHLDAHQPFPGCDWWLFDGDRVMVMHFDAGGTRTRVELTTDPGDVAAAVRFADLAMAAPWRS